MKIKDGVFLRRAGGIIPRSLEQGVAGKNVLC